jgi:Holliday junction DNA helicase RuvA
MIGRLRGALALKKPPFLLVDVEGVGYECQASMSTIYQLPEVGESVTLLTHLVVREDAQLLYAFYDEKERALFKTLIKISGVGPKMALTILSGMDVSMFLQCIERKDVGYLVKLPGVGKKTAERLVVEMTGKGLSGITEDFCFSDFSEKIGEKNAGAYEEAVGALIALGYKPQEASKAVSAASNDQSESSTQDLIRTALQGLARV